MTKRCHREKWQGPSEPRDARGARASLGIHPEPCSYTPPLETVSSWADSRLLRGLLFGGRAIMHS